ncbi:MAG TPA: TetR/AcrR family transcriptional regulator [Alphaproteobacteria bacterium]|nr:TetR/AcrR family transcriptional regulator [Alphaproteobacteria bacterium]
MDAAPVKAGRRSQEERSRDMRRLFAEAMLDALQECGYQGASLSAVLARAGVSRGAWAHHFETKRDLVVAAAEHMFESGIADAAAMAREMAGGDDAARLEALVEAVWRRFYQGRHRDVLFELAVASRTDDVLRDRLAPVFLRLQAALAEVWGAAFPAADAAAPPLLAFSMFMLRGMAMQTMLADDPPQLAQMRRDWAAMLAGLLRAEAGNRNQDGRGEDP